MSTDETHFFPATLPRSVVGFVIGKAMSFIFAFRREKFTVIRISSEFFFFTGTMGEQKSDKLSLITPASRRRLISFCTLFSTDCGNLYGLDTHGLWSSSSILCFSTSVHRRSVKKTSGNDDSSFLISDCWQSLKCVPMRKSLSAVCSSLRSISGSELSGGKLSASSATTAAIIEPGGYRGEKGRRQLKCSFFSEIL